MSETPEPQGIETETKIEGQVLPAVETPTSTEPQAQTKPEAQDPPPWYNRRIDELTRLRRDEERAKVALQLELDTLKAKIAAGQPSTPGLTQAQLEARAAELADVKMFNDQCDRVAKQGEKDFPDFQDAVARFQRLGGMTRSFIEAAMETDVPQKVIYEMSKDLNRAADILGMPVARQAAAIAKFALSLEAKPAKQSSAPPPVKPLVNGSGSSEPTLEDENLPMEKWMVLRKKQLAGNKVSA